MDSSILKIKNLRPRCLFSSILARLRSVLWQNEGRSWSSVWKIDKILWNSYINQYGANGKNSDNYTSAEKYQNKGNNIVFLFVYPLILILTKEKRSFGLMKEWMKAGYAFRWVLMGIGGRREWLGLGGYDQNGGAIVFNNPQRSSRILSSFNNIINHIFITFTTRLI